MFLKQLKITNEDGLIRQIDFRLGMNFIVDETQGETADTGNNVGKTTLLRLIDFCLGGEPQKVYSTDKSTNDLVKRFLQETCVTVELHLQDSLLKPERQVCIRRGFGRGRNAVCEINGKAVVSKDLALHLQQAFWGIQITKPSFRQIISHSLRIDDDKLNSVMQTFPTSFARGEEYEALHLFMFGADTKKIKAKVELRRSIHDDETFRNRLEKEGELGSQKARLAMVDKDIERLEAQKNILSVNPDFEADLDRMAFVKSQLGRLGAELGSLQVRRDLILEATEEMKQQKAKANADQVRAIYEQAKAFNQKLHHTFDQLLTFHNEMLARRSRFIDDELPQLNSDIDAYKADIFRLRDEELELKKKLNLSVSYETFDKILTDLNLKYQEKGELEHSVSQLQDVADRISEKQARLDAINEGLYSKAHQALVQKQLDKFNAYFSTVSRRIYGVDALMAYDIHDKGGKKYYEFMPVDNDSFSTGKKQGEIMCFDLAYIPFADAEKIPCLHFILNDKKELLSNNQLELAAKYVEERHDTQFIVAMLSDKMPEPLREPKYIVQTLRLNDRLLRIEQSAWYIKNKG